MDKRATNVVSRLVDIIGYSRAVQDTEGNITTKLFLRGTPRYMAGSRFAYIPSVIDFNYQSLVDAIGEAIDKQEEASDSALFTDEYINPHSHDAELDFDNLMTEFNSSIEQIVKSVPDEKFREFWQPRIVEITEKYLGNGMKVNQCSRGQSDALSLIVDDLKILMKNNLQKSNNEQA